VLHNLVERLKRVVLHAEACSIRIVRAVKTVTLFKLEFQKPNRCSAILTAN
jgi:hypothetical protein